MILTCPACQTRYLVPDTAVGPAGRQVRCAACKHSWLAQAQPQPHPSTAAAPPTAAAVPVAPEPSPVAPSAEPAPPPAPAMQTFAGEPVAAHPHEDWSDEPLFRPRRNRLRLLTWGAVLFALLALAGIAALIVFGTGDLAQRIGLHKPENPLVIEVSGQPERRTLPSGNELLTISGRIINPTSQPQSVNDLRAELRDARGRKVYAWTIGRPVRTLAPGAQAEFDTAAVDVPRRAQSLDLSFADGAAN